MGFVQDIVSKGFGGYRGWQDTEAEANYKATGGSGKYDMASSQQYAQQYNLPSPQSQQAYTAPSVQPFEDTVKQTQELYRKAAEPAITSLKASKPEITASISSKTQILKDKYDNLIASITGNQAKAENRQTVVTAGELGKRGIDPTSTLYGQELTSAINPITQDYTGLQKDATSNLQAGIQDLGDLETTQLRNVTNAIAQLQMGAGEGAINTAMQLYQQAQTAAQNANSLEESRRQANIANALAQKIYETINLPESQANISNVQSQIADRNQPNTTQTALTLTKQRMQSDINNNMTYNQLRTLYMSEGIAESEIRQAYNSGPMAQQYGGANEPPLGSVNNIPLDNAAVEGYARMVFMGGSSASIPEEYKNAVAAKYNELYGKPMNK